MLSLVGYGVFSLFILPGSLAVPIRTNAAGFIFYPSSWLNPYYRGEGEWETEGGLWYAPPSPYSAGIRRNGMLWNTFIQSSFPERREFSNDFSDEFLRPTQSSWTQPWSQYADDNWNLYGIRGDRVEYLAGYGINFPYYASFYGENILDDLEEQRINSIRNYYRTPLRHSQQPSKTNEPQLIQQIYVDHNGNFNQFPFDNYYSRRFTYPRRNGMFLRYLQERREDGLEHMQDLMKNYLERYQRFGDSDYYKNNILHYPWIQNPSNGAATFSSSTQGANSPKLHYQNLGHIKNVRQPVYWNKERAENIAEEVSDIRENILDAAKESAAKEQLGHWYLPQITRNSSATPQRSSQHHRPVDALRRIYYQNQMERFQDATENIAEYFLKWHQKQPEQKHPVNANRLQTGERRQDLIEGMHERIEELRENKFPAILNTNSWIGKQSGNPF